MSFRWLSSKVALAIILLAVSAGTSTAHIATEVLTITGETRNLRPGLRYEHLIDHTGDLTFEQSRTSTDWFTATEPVPNYGYTEDVAWFRYNVRFDSAATERNWLMVFAFPYLQNIDVWFILDDGSVLHDEAGTHAEKYVSGKVDRTRLPHEIVIPEPVTRIRQIYARVQTRIVMAIDISIQERESYLAFNDRTPSILWLFLGLAGGLFLYNLFLYIFLRDRAYLIYLIYAATYTLFVPLAVDGYGTVLFPTIPWITDNFLITLSAIANCAVLFFTMEFLQLRTNAPRLNKVAWVVQGIWLILGVASLWLDPQISHPASNQVATINILIIGSGAFIAIRKGYRPAIFFAVGWSILLVMATIFIGQNLGQLPKTFFTEHSLQFGIAAEMVMLSIALAARISDIRRKQQEDAKKALEGEIYRLKTIELQRERDNADRLLLNILPPVIATRLKQDENPIVDRFQNVAILFADIVGFTSLAEQMSPGELVSLLDDVFSEIDALVQKHGLEKIKTIGDCYMAVSGLPEPRSEFLIGMAEAALELREALDVLSKRHKTPISMRIGVHVGEVVAGVIGRTKFAYDLWGAAVNMASRMETHGQPGRIHVSESFANAMRDDYEFEERGEVSIKGMGTVRTYFLVDRKPHHSPQPTTTERPS